MCLTVLVLVSEEAREILGKDMSEMFGKTSGLWSGGRTRIVSRERLRVLKAFGIVFRDNGAERNLSPQPSKLTANW